MCGICGIINFNHQKVAEESLYQMMKAMKHRGPDDEGIFITNNVGLGFVRLSIIDLTAAGHQPFLSADKRYIMVFNGEIYNYIEIREELEELGYHFTTRTDTEVLLTSFIHWGESCLRRFNGMWAFVIYDQDKDEIFGARDRYGVKPFYYLIRDSGLVFASDITSILKILPEKPKPNEQSVFDYLVFNRTDQNENTFFNHVKKLQHGHSFVVKRSSMIIRKWYDLPSSLKSPFSSPDEFKDTFVSSLRLRLRSDVPVGVCLSGGLDSSAIVSTLIKDFDKKDLNTFSAVYGNGMQGDESRFINEYRTQLSRMYFTTPTAETLLADLPDFVKAHAEPIPSTSPYAQFKVMQLAKNNVVVTLDGQGADEQLAGYHYFFGFYFKDLINRFKLTKLFSEASSYMKNHRSVLGLTSLVYFLLPVNARTKIRVTGQGYLNQDFVKKYEKSNSIVSTLYSSNSLHEALLDHFEYKLEHLLKWEDKNSMYFSLEARTPFLDYRLVERTLALAPEQVIKNGMTKHILRESMKDILPEAIRNRKDKIGFGTPQNTWFKEKVFHDYVKKLLLSGSFRSRNLIDTEKAEKLYLKHLLGKVDISKEIWKWIHLENWFREFID